MAILETRIGTRDLRSTLKDVYGSNPFDTVKQLNKPLESVLGKLKDLRRSLGVTKSFIDSFKGIQGLVGNFDLDGITSDLLDALGVNIFGRTFNDIKAEIEGILSIVGTNSKSSIDRVTGTSSYTLDTWQVQLDNLMSGGAASIANNQLDVILTGSSSTGTTNPYSPTPTDNTTTTGVPTGTTVETTTSPTTLGGCVLPVFSDDSTILDMLVALGAQVDSGVSGTFTGDIPTTTTLQTTSTTTEQPPFSYPVADVLVLVALIAIVLGDYKPIGKLPVELQQVVADVLVAVGLDTNNVDAILAGLQYGDVPHLLEIYTDLLDTLLALANDLQEVVNSINSSIPTTDVPSVILPEVTYETMQGQLPPTSTILPVPFISAIQAIVILAVTISPVTQRKIVRKNYLHTYYPR